MDCHTIVTLYNGLEARHNALYCVVVYGDAVVALRFCEPQARNNMRAPFSSAGKKTKFYCTVALFRLNNIYFH